MGKSTAIVVCALAILIYFIVFRKKTDLPPALDGKYLSEFKQVAEVFREQIESGEELGGNFAAYYKGQLVVDLWGGYADTESLQKWRNDTLPITFSTTKGIVSVLAAKMVDQNLLDYNRLVSDYWPEFGSNGKENITVEILLHHMAGLSYLDNPISLLDLHNQPEIVESILAKERPKWPPGTAYAYHALTFGAYVDRLLTKADPQKRRIDKLFQEEIAIPLDIDFSIGLPRSQAYRAARFNRLSISEFMLDCLKVPKMWGVLWKMLTDSKQMVVKSANAMKEATSNDPYLREVALSSAHGHGTARAIAKLYGTLANNGKYGNKQLISEETLKKFSSPKDLGISLDLGRKVKMGLGVLYYLNPKNEPVYGHSGYGGQMTYADPINNIGVAYLTNDLSVYSFGDDPKFKALEKALYSCLEKVKNSGLSSKYISISL